MEQYHEEQFGVFFSNLEDEAPRSRLIALVISFIFQTTGILVSERDIAVRHSDPCKCNTACVDLHDADLQRRTLEAARLSQSAPKGLVKRGRVLRADYFQPRLLQKALRSPSPDDPPLMRRKHFAKKQNLANRMLIMKTLETLPPLHDGRPQRKHLVKNQRLGNETRVLEFKRGGGEYMKKYMRRHLAKYICAFLNSEGGTLMIGVDDEGVVQGVQCDHREEDRVRIMIDQLINHFDPPVLPQMYWLDFIPVHDTYSTDFSTISPSVAIPELKVLEIAVRAGRSNILYETPEGEVFIRRDGSVQGPLRAKDIQEWCHLKLSQEYQDRENALRLQIDTLEVRLGKIERQQNQQAGNRQRELTPGTSADVSTTTPLIRESDPSPNDSPVDVVQVERKNSLKRTNSKVCIIL